jgi:hypothetical protein
MPHRRVVSTEMRLGHHLPIGARMRIISLLAVVLALSCAKVGEVPSSQLPPYLRPLPGAKNIDARWLGPEAGIAYSLAACYPATAELRLIAERISPMWTPRTEDYLNPGIPTSQVRGWTRYYDARKNHGEWVHHWAGQWQEPHGDILSYNLVYRSPGGWDVEPEKPATCDVFITAQVVSAEKVRELQRSAAARRRAR